MKSRDWLLLVLLLLFLLSLLRPRGSATVNMQWEDPESGKLRPVQWGLFTPDEDI